MQSRIIDVPLNKLVASDANVRRTNRAVGVEELAANIAARGGELIQSLAVRPVRNQAGEETGTYRVSAGGRRLAALKLLAKRKVIAKSAAIPCIVSDGEEGEVSLAENVMREPLHPADQFDAFKALIDQGQGVEDVAARFGVSAHTVRQRLRLASVSPRLVQLYRDGALTLDQLMAFAVIEDHERQEHVHRVLASNVQPYLVRRMLTEAQVPARDRRAVFIGVDAYIAACGSLTRDLFSEDHGGWFDDATLLERLAIEKLQAIALELTTRDGWKWAQAHIDPPNAHGLARVYPKTRALSDEEQSRLDAATAKYETLAAECEGLDEVSTELDVLSAEVEAICSLRRAFDPEDIARSGAFVTLGQNGGARIECGFVRAEDEPPADPEEQERVKDTGSFNGAPPAETKDDATPKPLSDGLVRDLTAHRTMALRFVLGEQPETALVAVVHALALRTFYGSTLETCLDLNPRSVGLGMHAAGIDDTTTGRKLAERGQAWAEWLPDDPGKLWAYVANLGDAERLALLAHCASLTVFAVRDGCDRSPWRSVASDTLARATALDMSAHWKATTASYFDRVTKARIMEAVREAVSDEAARPIEGLPKRAMADAAEGLLLERDWLPAPLRSPEDGAPSD